MSKTLRNNRLNITEYDIKECSDTVQLLEWKMEVDKDSAEISQQINIAKAKALGGEYSDPIWFQNAIGAKKCQGMLSQMIQNRISMLNKENKEIQNNKNENMLKRFMEIASQELPEKTFLKLLNKTEESFKEK